MRIRAPECQVPGETFYIYRDRPVYERTLRRAFDWTMGRTTTRFKHERDWEHFGEVLVWCDLIKHPQRTWTESEASLFLVPAFPTVVRESPSAMHDALQASLRDDGFRACVIVYRDRVDHRTINYANLMPVVDGPCLSVRGALCAVLEKTHADYMPALALFAARAQMEASWRKSKGADHMVLCTHPQCASRLGPLFESVALPGLVGALERNARWLDPRLHHVRENHVLLSVAVLMFVITECVWWRSWRFAQSWTYRAHRLVHP